MTRRVSDNFLTFLLCAAGLCGSFLPPAALAAWQDPAGIATAASEFVMRQRQLDPEVHAVTAQSPDARLRLNQCDVPLDAAMLSARRQSSRVTVKVSCNGDVTWKVYVPVQISSFADVVVATRNLPRGHVLEPGDVTLRRDNVTTQPAGYLMTLAAATGRVLRQSVTAGALLTPGQLARNDAIARGQAVTLVADRHGISIRMAGIAMDSGPLGARISAKNANSGTIVEGVIVSDSELRVTGRGR